MHSLKNFTNQWGRRNRNEEKNKIESKLKNLSNRFFFGGRKRRRAADKRLLCARRSAKSFVGLFYISLHAFRALVRNSVSRGSVRRRCSFQQFTDAAMLVIKISISRRNHSRRIYINKVKFWITSRTFSPNGPQGEASRLSVSLSALMLRFKIRNAILALLVVYCLICFS